MKTVNEHLVFISYLAEVVWREKAKHCCDHALSELETVNKDIYFPNFSNLSLFPISQFSLSSSLTQAVNIFICLLLSPPSLPTTLYHCFHRNIWMFLNFSGLKLTLFNLAGKALCELVCLCLSLQTPFDSSGSLPHSSHTGFPDAPLDVPYCFLLWKLHTQFSFSEFCSPFINLLKPSFLLRPRSCMSVSLNYSFWMISDDPYFILPFCILVRVLFILQSYAYENAKHFRSQSWRKELWLFHCYWSLAKWWMMDTKMLHFLTHYAGKIESIHFSDQFSGPKIMQEYVWDKNIDQFSSLAFCVEIPAKCFCNYPSQMSFPLLWLHASWR